MPLNTFRQITKKKERPDVSVSDLLIFNIFYCKMQKCTQNSLNITQII